MATRNWEALDMDVDIRWKQRFQNFDRAFILLRSAMEEHEVRTFSMLERDGLIKRFEFTYELAWKTLKDYLEYSGSLDMTEITARSVFKAAFAANIIQNEQAFISMMLSRNLLSHCYDVVKLNEVIGLIKSSYLQELSALHQFFLERVNS